jgi:uncharacterized protein
MTASFIKPELTEVNRGFWEACAHEMLAVQCCSGCRHLRYPPASRCPECLSAEWTWEPLSGRGEVLSYIVIHQKYNAAWADRVPYNVAIIQLDEGPRIISNVLPLSGADVEVGMRVRVIFEDEDGVTVPRFEPADNERGEQ